jgi:thiamine transporter ThiT
MTEFTSWEAVKASAPLIVGVFVQFTKGAGFVKRIPTQLWSIIVAVILSMLAHVFSGEITASSVMLTVINSVFLSLTANGAHSAVTRIKAAAVKGDEAAPP